MGCAPAPGPDWDRKHALQHPVARVAFHAFIVCTHTHTPPLVLHCTSPAAALSAGVACCQFCCCKGFRVRTPVWGLFCTMLCCSHEQGGPGAAQAAPPQSEALRLSLCTCSLASASRHEGICAARESAVGCRWHCVTCACGCWSQLFPVLGAVCLGVLLEMGGP